MAITIRMGGESFQRILFSCATFIRSHVHLPVRVAQIARTTVCKILLAICRTRVSTSTTRQTVHERGFQSTFARRLGWFVKANAGFIDHCRDRAGDRGMDSDTGGSGDRLARRIARMVCTFARKNRGIADPQLAQLLHVGLAGCLGFTVGRGKSSVV